MKFDPTNTSKIFFPEILATKGDLIAYYKQIAPTILPYLKGRPMVMHRHPNGAGKKGFFHKDTSDLHLPSFVKTTMVYSASNERDQRYILVNNIDTLRYVVNLGCIELNPWESRAKSIHKPDFYVIDIDPGGRSFSDVLHVAKVAHQYLELSCERSYIKTSGKSGLHIYVPLSAKYNYDQVRTFSEMICRLVHDRLPAITSLERMPHKRRNKIYLDYMRNAYGQTAAAAYSVRPTPTGTVSTPLEWREVRRGLDPKKFTMKTIFARLKKKGDLWKPVIGRGVDLRYAITCLRNELS